MSSLAAIQSQLAAQKEPPPQTNNTDREPKRNKQHTQKNDETSGEEDESSTEEEGSDPDSDLESDPESNPTPPNMFGSLIGNASSKKWKIRSFAINLLTSLPSSRKHPTLKKRL